jgi:hypothetical protein
MTTNRHTLPKLKNQVYLYMSQMYMEYFFLYLAPLSAIFLLYPGGQLYRWSNPDYPRETSKIL